MTLRDQVLVLSVISLMIACSGESSSSEKALETGKDLSRIYCSSCHKYPEPALLDKTSWNEYMLPRMGYMLGIYESDSVRNSLIETGKGGEFVEAMNIYPKVPAISKEDWEKIKSYYLASAPEELPQVKNKTIPKTLSLFEVVKSPVKFSPPSSTLAKFNQDGEVYFSDAHTQKLIQLDPNLNLIKAGNVSEGAVCIDEIDSELWITVMGSFSPSDAPKGFVLNLPENQDKRALKVADELRRPVHTSIDDLNNDGKVDLVVSEFGKWTGRLSLFMGKGNKEFDQKILINQSGAIRTYIRDFNGDGLKDIIALFGQGNESIYILYNKGDFEFTAKRILQFSPSNGSSYFSLYDYDNDGDEDIIYCSGDNADFKPVMKPYHGIYIFKNKGDDLYEEAFFYQLNGAYAAIPADFDQDGDLDIAAISFFPDYQNSPEESFVFLENDGDMNYKASTISDPDMGRWIVMDAGDFDMDGDLDLILGSLAFEVIPDNGLVGRWMEEGIPFIILRNRTK
jgi:hypothetical protein